MLGIYRVAAQLVASQVVLSSTELVIQTDLILEEVTASIIRVDRQAGQARSRHCSFLLGLLWTLTIETVCSSCSWVKLH
jgi:hypothetical protein